LSCGLWLIVFGNVTTAAGQLYAPPQPPSAAVEGTGNPFLRRGPRMTAVSQPASPILVDGAAVPSSFVPPSPPSTSAVPSEASSPPTALLEAPPPVPPAAGLRGTAILAAAAAGPADPNEHPLAPVVRWAEDALLQLQGVDNYTCTFSKRERVNGRIQEQQVMYAKVRHQPYSVYLQFLSPNDVKGQEALYVDGLNQGRLLAHPVGIKQALVGTLSLAPNDPQAMDGNLYPITDFGVRRLIERYHESASRELQYGECQVRIVPGARVGDRTCTCVEVTHPVRRAEFNYHITRLYVDDGMNVPIHYEGYDWPAAPGAAPQLIEDYTYQGLRLNAGLGPVDFDAKNPNYRF